VDVRRVRIWEWLTGLAGVVLLVSLFLPWYRVAGQSSSGWQWLTVIDVVLAAAGLAAIALPVVTASQRTTAVPQAMTALLAPLLLAAALLAVYRLLRVPSAHASVQRQIGPWLAAASAVAALVCDWRSLGDHRFPAAMRRPLEVTTLPTPSADGERRDVPS
jgi:formate hydrogenlyase subunit 3/multisubunit Na+/H+ antiporter MnhD subunit